MTALDHTYRYEGASEIQGLPTDSTTCLRIRRSAVQMSITVQQMVMRPRTGELAVQIPD